MDSSDEEMQFLSDVEEEIKVENKLEEKPEAKVDLKPEVKTEEIQAAYIPPQYERTSRICQECGSTNWNLPPENEEEKKDYELYLPYFYCAFEDVLLCTLWAMEKHEDHTVISLKMVIGYCDSLFNETRSFVTDPNLYKIIPEELMNQYKEIEDQYAYVDRKFLNFHNIMLLKRHIEKVTNDVKTLCTEQIQKCPQSLGEQSTKAVTMIEDKMQPCKRLTADGEELNLVISDKKETLDWEFSVLEVDPKLEKDRIIMEDLRGYKLIKVSKLIMIYDTDYIEDIHKFFSSLHHVSEFTLKTRDLATPTPLLPTTLPYLVKIYSCTYEQFELIGTPLCPTSCLKLGEAFQKNRNNLTLNLKSCSLTTPLLAHLSSPLLTSPRILFLQYLSLSHNNLTSKSCSILSLLIPYFEYLNLLDLSHNEISDSGAKALSKSFKYMTRVVFETGGWGGL